MRMFLFLIVALSLLLAAADGRVVIAEEKSSVQEMLPELHLLDVPWQSKVIHRESSILLQSEEGAPLLARLAFPAEEILEVRSADGSKQYKLDRDFHLRDDRRTLEFPASTDTLFVTQGELFVPTGSPNSYPHRVDDPQQSLMYHTGDWFHVRQIEITYRRPKAEWVTPAPRIAEKELPKTFELLRAGKPLKFVIAGDSITAGGDASAMFGAEPKMPPFPDLIAAQLEASYGSDVTLKNLAVGGASVADGVASIEKYVAEKPDLLLIGFGMNDVSRRNPEWFKTETAKLIEGVRAELPNVEIILVSSMLGNNEWVHTPRNMFGPYRDGLAELTGPSIVLADVTSVWELLLEHKHDLDLIGNGLNHPNDYGHRVYAQTVLGLLVTPNKAVVQ